MDQENIGHFLIGNCANPITWLRKTLAPSHIGGAWEKQICFTGSTLSSIEKSHGYSLSDESFKNLIREKEAILNSRLLLVETLNAACSYKPLLPADFLTMKRKVAVASLVKL